MATPWPIGESRPGYCAATDGEEPGDCATGESGSWSTSGIRDIDECATQCLSCARCRFVTYGEDDCSWYARATVARRSSRVAPYPRRLRRLHRASVQLRDAALARVVRAWWARDAPALRAGGAQLPATVVATPSSLPRRHRRCCGATRGSRGPARGGGDAHAVGQNDPSHERQAVRVRRRGGARAQCEQPRGGARLLALAAAAHLCEAAALLAQRDPLRALLHLDADRWWRATSAAFSPPSRTHSGMAPCSRP